jgi:hypothetical protein
VILVILPNTAPSHTILFYMIQLSNSPTSSLLPSLSDSECRRAWHRYCLQPPSWACSVSTPLLLFLHLSSGCLAQAPTTTPQPEVYLLQYFSLSNLVVNAWHRNPLQCPSLKCVHSTDGHGLSEYNCEIYVRCNSLIPSSASLSASNSNASNSECLAQVLPAIPKPEVCSLH